MPPVEWPGWVYAVDVDAVAAEAVRQIQRTLTPRSVWARFRAGRVELEVAPTEGVPQGGGRRVGVYGLPGDAHGIALSLLVALERSQDKEPPCDLTQAEVYERARALREPGREVTAGAASSLLTTTRKTRDARRSSR